MRLDIACGACGHVNLRRSQFCTECGHRLETQSHVPRDRALGGEPYTPKHLVEKVLKTRSALEGERKQVTVLFVDVVDSSRLSESLDPEGVHQVMDRLLRLMAEAVHRYEGTVNQFLGDGVMALFGAPIALEDHALRAVQAALAIQESVRGYSDEVKRERGIEILLRIGLNSGGVVVGKIGDDLRMDYTAIGDTTNLAARLQQRAEPGTIMISEPTQRLVEGYVRLRPLGPMEVKGRSDRVTVFEVTGRRRRRTRLDVRRDTGLTDFIGRQRELGILLDGFERVQGGRGQIIGIVGEPGVGKSRLLYEFRQALRIQRHTWLEAQCAPYGQTTPYLPILEILRLNFQIDEGDNPLQIREKLRHGLREVGLEPGEVLPALAELFGLSAENTEAEQLGPKERRQRSFAAVRALTFAGSERRPAVFVVEDLHWIDRTSEELLEFLVASLAGIRCLLITTHRPGYTIPWGDKSFYTQIALDVLNETEVERMVQRLVGTRTPPPGLVQTVWARADGNPLFVEEIVGLLRERGLLDIRDGEVVYQQPLAVPDVPGTVQDLIRARLDRLDEPTKRTVETAAVIGRTFGLNVLQRVSELEGEVQRYLDSLKRLQLVHEARFLPELEYIFKHAVIQDVAYQGLLSPRRKELHGAIAQAIEELYGEQLDEQAPILAYHYARSTELDRAVHYTVRAGDRAAALYANAEATKYYEQALEIAQRLPSSVEMDRSRVDIAIKLAGVGLTRQDIIERDRGNLEAARVLAEQGDDRPRLAQVLYWLGRLAYVQWQPDAALGYARRSLEIAEELADEGLTAPPVNLMGRIYWQQSEFGKASRLLERSTEQMRRLNNRAEESTAVGFAAFALGFIGEFDRAGQYADYALQLAQELKNPFAEASGFLARGIMLSQQGDWTRAFRDYEDSCRVAERTNDMFRIYVVRFFEGEARTIAGDPLRGRAILEENLALGARLGTRFGLAWQKAFLALALHRLGEHDRVEELCRDATQIAEQARDRYPEAYAYRTWAEAQALDPSRWQDAEAAMLRAIRIQEEIQVRPQLARTFVIYARLLVGMGQAKRARELLERAITMFREMMMTWDLDGATRTLAEIEE
jgi:class 3 adenylate cyclase/tetratricopeptide (TPR) repeat protein